MPLCGSKKEFRKESGRRLLRRRSSISRVVSTSHMFSGVVVGQPIEFRNSDDTNHNIHPLPRQNEEWNESQPPKGSPKTKTFEREEIMVPIKCNIHPWMRAYVGVLGTHSCSDGR